MAKNPATQTAEVPADLTAKEILATPTPAPLAEQAVKATRAPSKTRHLSAIRSQQIESVISLLSQSKSTPDKTIKDAALTLAMLAIDRIAILDADIAKLQSGS